MPKNNYLDPNFRGPRIFEYDTCKEAFLDIHRKWLYGELAPHMFGGPRGAINDVTIVVHNPAPDVNLLDAGFNAKRWPKFMKDYLDPTTYAGWCSSIWSSAKGQEIMYYTLPRAGHSLGNCVTTLSINGHSPYRLAMMSRTSQWTPTASLDLNFAALSAQIASSILRLDKTMPFIWTINGMQYMVVAAGMLVTAIGEYGELVDYVENYPGNIDKENKVARDVYKHIGYAINHKQTTWKTFARFWQKIRDNLDSHEKNIPMQEFYPEIPAYFWSPFQENGNPPRYNAEQLEKEWGVNRKWLRFRIRPFRKLIHDRWGFPLLGVYDLMWPTNHPEYKIMENIYHHGGQIDNVQDIINILGVETEQEAINYCQPFYEIYRR